MKRRKYTHDPRPIADQESIDSQSAANQRPIPGENDRPRVPRPREQKLVAVLADGTARSITDAMRIARINPSSSGIRERLAPGGDLRDQLDKAMETAGLTIPSVLQKLRAKMDSTNTIRVGDEALSTEDNNAQLRATELTIKLLDRAGRLPAEQESVGNNSPITVNVLVIGET